MIKFTQGRITNPETGIAKDIVVQAVAPNKLKDILIGGSIVMVGITYLTVTAFKHGSLRYEDAEMQAFSDIGVLD